MFPISSVFEIQQLMFQVMHPFYDNYSCLIIQVFGLDLIYQMKPEHDEPGTFHSIKNGELALGDDQILAWGVVPLFEGWGSV